MPSAFTHALVGASFSTALPRPARTARVALLLAALAAAPDLDVVAFRLGIPYGHPLGHRGFSHSLTLAVLLGAGSLPLWLRVLPRRAGSAALVTFLAVASHGILDAFTDGGLGVGLFVPFDNGRYFAPWRPILVSPLSAGAFLSARGLAVLASETLWVDLPVLLLVAVVAALRSVRPPARPPPGSADP